MVLTARRVILGVLEPENLFSYPELKEIARIMIRRKLGYKYYPDGYEKLKYPRLYWLLCEVEKRIVLWINYGYMYRCIFCGMRGFTKRGIYLHLIRKHIDDVVLEIMECMKRILSIDKEHEATKKKWG